MKLLISPKIITETQLNVNTYDIDVAGHVNNLVYIRWLEDMRNIIFAQLCPLNNLLKLNYYPVVVACEMRYKKQIKLFDKPIGKMEVFSYIHGIFVLKAEIMVSKVIAFTAIQKCVLLNLENNIKFKGNPSIFNQA